jgi:hypothetical protein
MACIITLAASPSPQMRSRFSRLSVLVCLAVCCRSTSCCGEGWDGWMMEGWIEEMLIEY